MDLEIAAMTVFITLVLTWYQVTMVTSRVLGRRLVALRSATKIITEQASGLDDAVMVATQGKDSYGFAVFAHDENRPRYMDARFRHDVSIRKLQNMAPHVFAFEQLDDRMNGVVCIKYESDQFYIVGMEFV